MACGAASDEVAQARARVGLGVMLGECVGVACGEQGERVEALGEASRVKERGE